MSIEDYFDDLINLMKIKRQGHPILFTNKLTEIKNSEASFKTIAGDVGSATASTSTDTFTIVGGDNVATSITGTTMTISIGYFMEYKGTHDASSGAYPTSPEQGDVWVASVAGTLVGTYYNIGDWMVYNGTSWDKIEGSIKLENDASPKLAAALDANSKQINNLAAPSAASDGATKDYVDTAIGAGGHAHDTDTLQLDGINSNGGAFSFTTSGVITFNQNLAFSGAQTVDGVDISTLSLNTLPTAASGNIDCNGQAITNVGNVDGIDVSALSITNMPTAVNNWKMYCTNGAGVMTELATGAAGTVLTGNGVAAAPSFQAVASSGWTVVDDVADLQTALDNGGAILLKAGTYTLTATLDIDQSKSVVMIGAGAETIINSGGDRRIFNITACDSCIIHNMKLQASSYAAFREIISINEASDNPILIANIHFDNDSTNSVGIEIDSENVIVSKCRFTNVVNTAIDIDGDNNSVMGCYIDGGSNNGGIYNSGSYCKLTNNTIINSGYCIYSYGDYNILSDNYCSSGYSGIYATGAYNTITGNVCCGNTVKGIEISGLTYSTVGNNTCNLNNLNDAASGGGIYANATCSNNSIIGNVCYGNANAGAGSAYGIKIDNANCDNNIIKNNRLIGNDITADDVGGNNAWEFDAFTRAEIEDITTNFSGSCIINLPNGTIDLAGNTITVSGGGSYIIQGQGDSSVIDIGGDTTAFDITSCTSCVLRDFKIDAIDLITATKEIIDITEGSGNSIIIERVFINGDGSNGYAIECNSGNVIINKCRIYNVLRAIRILSVDNCRITDNRLDTADYGIELSSSSSTASENIISGNEIDNMAQAGILADNSNGFSGSIISNNICHDCTNGIRLNNSVQELSVVGNTCYNNTTHGIDVGNSSICNDIIVSNNYCYSNANGINVYGADDSLFSGNLCNNNTLRGIYVNASDNCTFAGNVCNNNNLNSATSGGGIWIDNDSDNNTVSGNVCNGNANVGAGTGNGIIINNANCNENTVIGNTALNNDTNYTDTGTNTFDTDGGAQALNNIA